MQPAAIITGAGRGIGRATAIQLAADGYRLLLLSRSTAELEQTAALCGAHKESHCVMAADVCDPDAVSAAVRRALEQFGRVEALVHCAGLAPLKAIDQLTQAQWHATIDTNLSAAFYFCQALWPAWRRQGGGTAVMVSSVAARDPFNGFSAYGAAKAGLNMFATALAREGASIGVRVHTVAPGAVETSMLRGVFTTQQIPEAAALAPHDVASVIAQCVRGALQYTSGEVIYVHKTA